MWKLLRAKIKWNTTLARSSELNVFSWKIAEKIVS